MPLKWMQNLLTGYILGLVLLLIFVGITYSHGKKIDATIASLANAEIPSLIAASHLKRDFQAQTLALYALYATNDENAYQKQYVVTKTAILIDASKLQSVLEKNQFIQELDKKILAQEDKASRFVDTMRQPEVDWDAARSQLSDFSNDAHKIEIELDELVAKVTQNTQKQAASSQALLAQLTHIGLLFAALLVVGLFTLVLFSQNQTRSSPIKKA